MKRLLSSILFPLLVSIHLYAHDDIPHTLKFVEDPSLARIQNAGSFADQWVSTFNELRFTTSNRADVFAIKGELDYVIENVYKIEQSERSNLLILTYRQGKRDYKVIIPAEQIRMIQEADPNASFR
ncbi:MAG: hypothetical protein ACPGES_02900 [Coraliomargarita sp.]